MPKDKVNGTVMEGIRDNYRHWWVVLRSSIIGIYVGLLPGLGGAIADWAAYGHVVQSSKDKSRFGKGDVRGVFAPESANNAMKGSALIPVIGFGIPGSAPMAILMGAFLIQGMTPGPEMLTTHLDVTFSMVWTLVIANIVAGLVLLPLTNRLAALSFIRGHLIFPAVLLFVLMGAWVDNNHIADWVCLIAFGVLGYLMRLGGFPRPPLILGFILGPVMENAYFLTDQSYRPSEWLTRPICIVLLLLIAGTLVMSVAGNLRKKAAGGVKVTEASEENPLVGGILTCAVTLVFVVTIVTAWHWPRGAALFPLAAAFPAVALAVLALWIDGRRIATALGAAGPGGAAASAARSRRPEARRRIPADPARHPRRHHSRRTARHAAGVRIPLSDVLGARGLEDRLDLCGAEPRLPRGDVHPRLAADLVPVAAVRVTA